VKPRQLLIGLFVAALVTAPIVWVLKFGFGRNPMEVPFVLRDKPAPAFHLSQLDGGEAISLAALRGKPVVLNFWASWCGPCEAEHASLLWAAKKWGSEVQFLGVIFEDTSENAKEFLAQRGSGFPQLVDPSNRVAIDYGIAGVPETFFIDGEGIIREKYVGPLSPRAIEPRIAAIKAGKPFQAVNP
jgi:cytochrome c biogenesis protein CcmG/thiol:disulfide interchange protein DsbE